MSEILKVEEEPTGKTMAPSLTLEENSEYSSNFSLKSDKSLTCTEEEIQKIKATNKVLMRKTAEKLMNFKHFSKALRKFQANQESSLMKYEEIESEVDSCEENEEIDYERLRESLKILKTLKYEHFRAEKKIQSNFKRIQKADEERKNLIQVLQDLQKNYIIEKKTKNECCCIVC